MLPAASNFGPQTVSDAFQMMGWGSRWPLDPKIALSFVTWLIYLGLIFSRWTAGWRGRKAAYFAIAGFIATVATWGANSGLHSFK